MKKIIKILFGIVLTLFLLLNIITAFHAYKFTHFYEQGEVDIKPNGDKTGWDITKEILFGINAVKQKNRTPDSSFNPVIITTRDGIQLQGWYIKTDSIAKGTIVMFHGHGSKKTSILAEAAGFRKLGYNTFLLDFRAHGSSGGNTSTIGFFETEDVKLAYDFVKNKGEKNILLYGNINGSSGGVKSH